MKVSLISPYSEISSLGIRAISSALKESDIKTRLIFLPLHKHLMSKGRFGKYHHSVIEALADVVRDDDLIGISVMSNYYMTVKDLTQRLRTMIKAPILWGGIHATVNPEQCIEVADYVCIGEGEKSLLELCGKIKSGETADSVHGIWTKNPHTHKSVPGATVEDLDSVPFQDYDFDDNYILIRNRLERLTVENVKKYMGTTYWTYYTRGCPFRCSYCCNNALKKLSSGLVRLRSKSPRYVVDEINTVRKKLPFINYIYFSDDTFFALTEKKIAEFCETYKAEVGLPFIISGLEPTVFTEKKLDYLADAGLLRVRMGIQTGSRKVLEMYNRGRQNNEQVMKVAESLQKYSRTMTMPAYDVILDNPWETKEDAYATIDLLSRLKAPFTLNVFSLRFFPGTELYDRGLREGLFGPDEDLETKHYHRKSPAYLNLIIALFGLFRLPKPLLEFFISHKRIKSPRVTEVLVNLVDTLTFYRRGIASLAKRDYSMFPPSLQLFLCRFFPHRSHRLKNTYKL